MNEIITVGLVGLVAWGIAAIAGIVSTTPIDLLLAIFRAIVGA